MTRSTWVLESDVFPDSHGELRKAIRENGDQLIEWDDSWWSGEFPSQIGKSITYFHGSLGNAARITEELEWTPGSFCKTPAFCCSNWYGAARKWLLHSDWRLMPANELVATAPKVADELNSGNQIFVRPNSPLKPFSGRVVDVREITLAALDHGFYFDDETIPVVAAPVCNVSCEWRFVVADSTVCAGSAYDAETRKATKASPDGEPWDFAQSVASELPPPAEVYVLDICEADGELKLLELNPFGGADLYACDAASVVRAVSRSAHS